MQGNFSEAIGHIFIIPVFFEAVLIDLFLSLLNAGAKSSIQFTWYEVKHPQKIVIVVLLRR